MAPPITSASNADRFRYFKPIKARKTRHDSRLPIHVALEITVEIGLHFVIHFFAFPKSEFSVNPQQLAFVRKPAFLAFDFCRIAETTIAASEAVTVWVEIIHVLRSRMKAQSRRILRLAVRRFDFAHAFKGYHFPILPFL